MRKYLKDKYGEEAIEAMEIRAQMRSGEDADTLREKILFYRGKNKEQKKRVAE
jgi:hypothetical protein